MRKVLDIERQAFIKFLIYDICVRNRNYKYTKDVATYKTPGNQVKPHFTPTTTCMTWLQELLFSALTYKILLLFRNQAVSLILGEV